MNTQDVKVWLSVAGLIAVSIVLALKGQTAECLTVAALVGGALSMNPKSPTPPGV